MSFISRYLALVLRGVLIVASLALGIFGPEWRSSLAQNVPPAGSCRSDADCDSGEFCPKIKLVTSPGPKGGTIADQLPLCSPLLGCEADTDCLATETCERFGPGNPNKCVALPDTKLPDTTIPVTRADPPERPPVRVSNPIVPVPPTPPAPPPEQPKQPPPKAPQKLSSPPKFYIVVVNAPDLPGPELLKILTRFKAELTRIYGEGKFTLDLKSATNKAGTKDNEYTTYLVGGSDSLMARKLLKDHGYPVDPFSQVVLSDVFYGKSQTRGANFGHVGIIAVDKTLKSGESSTSNSVLHETGHALLGYYKPDGGWEVGCAISHVKNSDGSYISENLVPEECRGVMVPSPSPNQDLGYTSKFIEKVPKPLLVTDVPRYTAVWEPSTEGEIQLYGWTEDDLRAKYAELWPLGWRLKLLSPYVLKGEVLYVAVFQPYQETTLVRKSRGEKQKIVPLPGGRDEVQVYSRSYDDYRTQYDQLWKQGWRLKLLNPYVINNEVRYTAVWQPGTESEIQLYRWSATNLRAKYNELWKQGWRLKLLSPYVLDGTVRFDAVLKPSTEDERQVFGWSYENYRAEYDRLWKEGWRLKLLSSYIVKNETRYTAVWHRSNNAEIQVYEWYYEMYKTEYDQLWNLGWRLKLLSVF